MDRQSRSRPHAAVVAVVMVLFCAGVVRAHDEDPAGGRPSHDGSPVHFSHPLIAESPSPDTKIRLDGFFLDLDDGGESGSERTLRLEAEYAFHPSFSIELDVPVTTRNLDAAPSVSSTDTVDISLKFASFTFQRQGVLLGYGLEIGLPTGNDRKEIGSDHLVVFEPFFDVGYVRGRLEVVAFVSFGIPTNQDDMEEVETELGENLSLLYHFTPRLSGLLELDGETVLSGPDDGQSVLNLTAGLKVRPWASHDLQVGVGLSVPVSSDEEFDTRGIVSVFYHF
ncbi:MAG: hypothetical protein ACE5IK_10500 [Acidobacteriota bacterium]